MSTCLSNHRHQELHHSIAYLAKGDTDILDVRDKSACEVSTLPALSLSCRLDMPVTRLPLEPRPFPSFFLGGSFLLRLDCAASAVTNVCQLHTHTHTQDEFSMGRAVAVAIAQGVKTYKNTQAPTTAHRKSLKMLQRQTERCSTMLPTDTNLSNVVECTGATAFQEHGVEL